MVRTMQMGAKNTTAPQKRKRKEKEREKSREVNWNNKNKKQVFLGFKKLEYINASFKISFFIYASKLCGTR